MKLNGHDVIAQKPLDNTGVYQVFVYRPDETHGKYVVAQWSENLGTSWVWGKYFNTFEAAAKEYMK